MVQKFDELFESGVAGVKIGIFGVSSQSGRAYLVDMLNKGLSVYGYARESKNGTAFVDSVNEQQGICLERPKENLNRERSRLVPLTNGSVGHDLTRLVEQSDLIILALPAHYLVSVAQQLCCANITKRRVPLILSPSRTFSVPYIWTVLGEMYPIVSFSTCPYSCKAPDVGTVYIKRRKRSWLASLEGEFNNEQIQLIEWLFPQAVFSSVPATTSLGNIGAVFHPGPYLLNYSAIKAAERENREYSFYMEGIAKNAQVAAHVEEVDQVRLRLAAYLGLEVFGLQPNPNEWVWKELMAPLRQAEKDWEGNIQKLRRLRHDHLCRINQAIVSAQHWLDYTYGVTRIEGESLQYAIARTPTYQQRSVPQVRYIEEDVPTGLIPLMSLAERFGVDASSIRRLVDLHDKLYPEANQAYRRDLRIFSTEFIQDYLIGRFFRHVD